MARKKIVVETKYTAKGSDKVKDAYKDIGDSAEKGAKATDKVNESIKETGEASKVAEGGLKGVLNGFKAIVMNPIGLVITAIAGAFILVKEALGKSEKAMNKVNQGMAFLKGLLVPLQKAVVSGFNLIVEALQEPEKVWTSFVDSFEKSVTYVKDNIIMPYISIYKLLALNVFKQITKMRLAWNEFTGDVEESEELQNKLKDIDESIQASEKVIKDAVNTIKNDVVEVSKNVVEGFKEISKEAIESANALTSLTKEEQRLLSIRRQQEVSNAKAIADIETLKTLRDNEANDLKDRLQANEEVGRIEEERVNKAIKLAQAELNLTRKRMKIEGRSSELLDLEKEQRIAIHELRNEHAGIEVEQNVNKTALLTEEFDKIASLIDKEKELYAIKENDAVKLANKEVEAQQKKLEALKELGLEEKAIYIETQNALEIAKATARQTELDAEAEASEKLKELNKSNQDKEIESAQKVADYKKELQQGLFNVSVELGNALLQHMDQDSKKAIALQKAMAIAQVTSDTALAISSLIKESNKNPLNGVTFGGAGALQFTTGAIKIATGMAKVSSILKTSPPSIDSGSSSAPTTTQTKPDLGFEGNTAGSENFGSQVVKAYVTETDITQAQNNASNTQNLSQLG